MGLAVCIRQGFVGVQWGRRRSRMRHFGAQQSKTHFPEHIVLSVSGFQLGVDIGVFYPPPAQQAMTRHWLQIHLSTAIVLMFVAAAMLGANIVERSTRIVDGADNYRLVFQGWPLRFRSEPWIYKFVTGWPGDPTDWRIDWFKLLLNIGLCAVALAVLLIILEYRIRRRKRGQLPAESKDAG